MNIEERLFELANEKFEKELQIESISHQLDMSLYRKEQENIKPDYFWLNKTKYKLNMLKIELKQLNLEFDKLRKESDSIKRNERNKSNVRLERLFMNLIKEDYGDEMFHFYLDRARVLQNALEDQS